MIDHAGESRQIRQEGAALTAMLAFAVVLIYLVLAAQFHSFRDPLIVRLGSVPLAIFGASNPLSWGQDLPSFPDRSGSPLVTLCAVNPAMWPLPPSRLRLPLSL